MQTGTFTPNNDSSNDTNTETKSLAQQAKQALVDILFSHTLKMALAHAVASLLLVFWLADVANLTDLTIWFCMVSLVSCFRLFLYGAYTRYCDYTNLHLWLRAWIVCTAIMSFMYVSALVYFMPFHQSEYAVASGLFIVSLTAGAVMTHSVSAYALLSFLLPITLIPSYFLITNGGESGLMTAVAVGVYTLVVLVFMKSISHAFKKSILLGLQHQLEIDKRKQAEHQLQEINRRDGLTGLYNRRYFDEILEAEIGRAHRNHQPLCVLMFDIDCFQEYNLKYGHVAGDNCLIDIAERAQNLANRKGDLMARYGGEEFAIILPNIDLTGAVAFANKLQNEIQQARLPHLTSKLTTLKCVTISVGVSNLPPFTKLKPEQLIKDAETALYEAKHQGRNRVSFNENNGLNEDASR